jgi:hypothetical protein
MMEGERTRVIVKRKKKGVFENIVSMTKMRRMRCRCKIYSGLKVSDGVDFSMGGFGCKACRQYGKGMARGGLQQHNGRDAEKKREGGGRN